ncbi:MAG: tRNA (guanosine(37)-N1)-methyltransferase TrmD [Myxococcales bacterium]|nr:tRNA (guanosine(37)-N1)-methyltransferase TrmD [Myxococcales bacterium]
MLTLFPEFFSSPLSVSILGKALEGGDIVVEARDIRAWATGKHRVTDDTPYGGGAGMVMKPGPVVRAMEAVDAERAERGLGPAYRVMLTPAGEPFSQRIAEELAEREALTLVCGRYEGVDERAIARMDRELSLGDFVLTGGEPAALTVLDAVIRLLPGVLGNEASAEDESFASGLLEYPQYTRPAEFRGVGVPDVLLSGHHAHIAQWRRGQGLLRTSTRRPDLMARLELSDEDRRLLEEARRQMQDHNGVSGDVPQEEDTL